MCEGRAKACAGVTTRSAPRSTAWTSRDARSPGTRRQAVAPVGTGYQVRGFLRGFFVRSCAPQAISARRTRLAPEPRKARLSGLFRTSGSGWIRTNVGIRQRVYSPSPLASRAHSQHAAAGRPRAESYRSALAQPIVPRRLWASGSVSSFLSVLFSIWRMRSRVTPNARPTSSSVRGRSPVRP